ncbi:10725_t:CDS:2, partial [Gigaspora rosea]
KTKEINTKTDDNIASGSSTVEQALSANERKLYDQLDEDGKKVYLESITKARKEGTEAGVKEGIEKERKKG